MSGEYVVLLDANLVTKTDIAGIKADFATLETRLEAFKSGPSEWMAGLLIVKGGLIVAFIKFL